MPQVKSSKVKTGIKSRQYNRGIAWTDGRCNTITVSGERCKNPAVYGTCKYHMRSGGMATYGSTALFPVYQAPLNLINPIINPIINPMTNLFMTEDNNNFLLKMERFEAEQLEAERLEVERLDDERLEIERLKMERLEAERLDIERFKMNRLREENDKLHIEIGKIQNIVKKF